MWVYKPRIENLPDRKVYRIWIYTFSMSYHSLRKVEWNTERIVGDFHMSPKIREKYQNSNDCVERPSVLQYVSQINLRSDFSI